MPANEARPSPQFSAPEPTRPAASHQSLSGSQPARTVGILHFTCPPIVGGVELLIRQHAELLLEYGYAVRVLAGRGGRFDRRVPVTLLPALDSKYPPLLTVNDELKAGEVSPRFEALVQELLGLLREHLQGLDVCIVHNVLSLHFNLPLTAAFQRLIAEGAAPLLVAWNHDLSWTNPLYVPLMREQEPWTLLKTKLPGVRYVVVSEDRRQDLLRLWGDEATGVRSQESGGRVPSPPASLSPAREAPHPPAAFEASQASHSPARGRGGAEMLLLGLQVPAGKRPPDSPPGSFPNQQSVEGVDDRRHPLSRVRERGAGGEGSPAPDPVVVPAGVDARGKLRLRAATVQLMRQLRLGEGWPFMLLPARITKRKNIEYAIQVTRVLRDLGVSPRLLVTGPPGPHNVRSADYVDELQAERARLDVHAEVTFLYEERRPDGRPWKATDAMMDDLYQLADLMIFPSAQEGFGIPILEAGLVRLPIFCSDIPSFREIAGENVHRFALDAPPAETAARILQYLEADPAVQLRHTVLRRFSWEGVFRERIEPLLHPLAASTVRESGPSQQVQEGARTSAPARQPQPRTRTRGARIDGQTMVSSREGHRPGEEPADARQS